MSTNYTEHLGLTLWEPDDPVLRTEFNENHRKLDARLRAMPRIAVGSYTGTGTYGSKSPNTLTFDFTPAMVVIVKDAASSLDPGTVLIRGQSRNPGIGYHPNASNSLQLMVDWQGNTVTWYTASGPSNQLNATGDTYCYFAIGV